MLQIKITELSSSSPNKTAKKSNLRIYKYLSKLDETIEKQISQSYDISLLKLKLNFEYHMKPKKNDHIKPKKSKKSCSALKYR